MPDWTKSMQQTFEYYEVDPDTWTDKRRLELIKSCNIVRNVSSDTLGSATIDSDEEIGEMYIRVYLVTIQNGITERFPLGTHLYQTTSYSNDGKVTSVQLDGYTPLTELKETMPPVGYSIGANVNVMLEAFRLTDEHVRAPVVSGSSSDVTAQPFVSNLEDTWFTFISDFISGIGYGFDLDDNGRILFAPNQDFNSLQPIWTYDDSNSSILYPDITEDHDLYGIPNVVEVVYSRDNGLPVFSRVVNDDPNSPISTVNRGREIVSRITDPDLNGEPTQDLLDIYARNALREASTTEHTLSYKHGYCPVRVGDCVMLDYGRAGINRVKAKVIRQSINCETGCAVEETAVYTTNLWG